MIRIVFMRAFLFTFTLTLTIGGAVQAYPNLAAGSVAVTVQPQVLQLHNTGRYLYALDGATGAISVFDTLFFKESTRITFSGFPKDAVLSNDGTTLYVLTSQADTVTKYSLTDPSLPADPTTIDLSSSGITFDNILVAGTSGADKLVLLSRGSQAIYVYDVSSSALVKSGSVNHVDVGFDPIGASLTPDKTRLAALSSGGIFKTFLVSSISQVGANIDFSSLTSTSNFSQLHVNTTGSLVYAFAVNNRSPGEVFLVNMSGANHVLSLTDADTTSVSTTDPIFVGNAPSAGVLAQVKRAKDNPANAAVYYFTANTNDGTLSVIDTAAIGGSSAVTAIDTIQNVSNVPAKGFALSSPDDGYIYAANQAGASITVVTDQPFLTVTSSPTDPVGSSADVSISSNQSGTLSAYQYTGKTTDAVATTHGKLIKTVSLNANEETTVTLPTDSLEEGANTIAFFLKNGDFSGRTAVTLTKDTPPATPTGFKLGFGNQKIVAKWNRVSAADMSHYQVYFGTSSADGGVSGLVSPQRVEQPSSGSLKFTIEPLDNGTTIYVNVVAVDKTGNESAPTDTLSETAEETIGLLGVSGEKGGCGAQKGAGGFFVWIIAILVFATFGRRSRGLWLFVVLFSSLTDANAQTQILRNETEYKPRTSVEFRTGWWVPKSSAVKSFYGKGGNEQYSLRFGFLFGDVDFGLEGGFLYESSKLKGVSSGRSSAESGSLMLVPIEFSAQYNLNFTEHPILVPVVRAGYDLTYFNVSEPTQSKSGEKHILAMTGGLRFNLERLGFGNDLEDLIGVKHFFIEGLVTYRHQFTKGIDFGGFVYQPGIGLEF